MTQKFNKPAEYSRRCVRAISPEAVTAVRELIRDPKSRDHARAIAMVLDRIDPPETTHNVKIEPSDQSARIEATDAKSLWRSECFRIKRLECDLISYRPSQVMF
jgi:hypothetical protein